MQIFYTKCALSCTPLHFIYGIVNLEHFLGTLRTQRWWILNKSFYTMLKISNLAVHFDIHHAAKEIKKYIMPGAKKHLALYNEHLKFHRHQP